MLEDIPAPGSSGQVIKSDGTNWTSGADAGLPAVGADGQVLTSDGTNWASEAAAAGGAWAVKSSGSFSTTSELVITSITKTIKVYLNFILSADSGVNVLTSTDGGSGWGGAPWYDHTIIHTTQQASSLNLSRVNNSGLFALTSGMDAFDNVSGSNAFIEFTAHSPESNRAKLFSWEIGYPTTIGEDDNKVFTAIGKGTWNNTTAVNAIKFYPGSGTFSAGTYTVLELN